MRGANQMVHAKIDKRFWVFLLAVLAISFLFAAIGLHGWRRTTSDPQAYLGIWVNSDPDTPGITKVEIRPANGTVLVHAWGTCRPQDCDWGEQIATFSADNARVNWKLGSIAVAMAFRIRGDDMLLRADYQYSDGRAHEQEADHFARQR